MEQDGLDVATRTACRILPAWFIPRMMYDEWSFGLFLTTGEVMCISRITKLHSSVGGDWLDVEMIGACYWTKELQKKGMKVLCAPTTRCTASVQINKIVAAFELADT